MKYIIHHDILMPCIHDNGTDDMFVWLNAAGTDFAPNEVDITFNADDDLVGSLELNKIINIPITDDDIKEADREYFILYLTLFSSALPGLELGTVVSVGGIDDNDSK